MKLYDVLPRHVSSEYKGEYLAKWLNKEKITQKDYLLFSRKRVEKEKKIIRLQHEKSIVEKIMRKYQDFPHNVEYI